MPRKKIPSPEVAAQEVWGEWMPEIEEEEPLELPPEPVSMPGGQGERARPAAAHVLGLGSPPKEAVKAMAWAFQVQLQMAYEAMADETLTPSARRREVNRALGGAAKHQNDALMFDALEAIEADKAEIERKRRGRAVAKLEKREPAPEGAKVIPLRRDG